MKLPKAAFILPYAASSAIGASLYAAAIFTAAAEPERRYALLLAAFTAGLAAVFAITAIATAPLSGWRRGLRLAFTPSALFAAGFGFFLMVERDITRLVIAAVLVGLVTAFLLTTEGMGETSPRYAPADLAHLAAMMHAAAAFFGAAFMLELPGIAGVHPAWMSFAAAALFGVLTHESLWHEGFARDRGWPVTFAFAVIGGEFHAALLLLPLLPLVGAALLTVLYVPAFNAVTLSLKGARPPLRPLAWAMSLAAVILATARWS